MLANELEAVFNRCPYPVTWHHFDRDLKPPFAVWKEEESQNVSSDFRVLRARDTISLDFYYETWNQKKMFENFLMSLPLRWDRMSSDVWISSEQMYLSSYSLENHS